jgi:uncharacterized protein (TIGR02444 family)
MSGSAPSAFWTFSLALYGKPGVAAALIGLQDRLGLDVNMLLFCCWAAIDDRRLTAADLAAVEAVAEPWQAEVVRPLRALRRRLKGGFAGLPVDQVEAYRKRLNELEIEGERIAQDAMAARLNAGGAASGRHLGLGGTALLAANLTAYLRRRNAAICEADNADLLSLVRGCFPAANLEEFSFLQR